MPNTSIQAFDLFEQDPTIRLRQLSDMASVVEVDHNVPTRRYFRSGMEMVRMANVYLDEGNYENAFILYSKFITLFVEKLPKHQDYKSAAPTDKANIKKKLNEVFPKAEKLKQHLKDRYAKDYEKHLVEKRRRAERLEKDRERIQAEEEKRRLQSEQSDHQLKIQSELEKWKISEPSNEFNAVNDDRLALSKTDDKDLYEWPDWTNRSADGSSQSNSNIIKGGPVIPSRELKPSVNSQGLNDICVTPTIDRSTKPSSLIGPSSSGSTSGSGTSWSSVRNVTVPSILMAEFLALAQKNTDHNVETCGILTGKLAQHRFTITHLLVPKQMGTADSCTTDNEEEIFEFQDQHDLITLGWIHTHPSQTSFMSSVDLHTHCAYQLMLPEAIAIVCSPKYNETGIYSLTNDYGLNYIAKCQQTGFHPHPKEPPIYIDSDHVLVDNTAKISVVDLR